MPWSPERKLPKMQSLIAESQAVEHNPSSVRTVMNTDRILDTMIHRNMSWYAAATSSSMHHGHGPTRAKPQLGPTGAVKTPRRPLGRSTWLLESAAGLVSEMEYSR